MKVKTLTLARFRELTKSLPGKTLFTYHGSDHGCCLFNYTEADLWLFPKGKPTKAVVLNPADDYDPRAARKTSR